MNIVCFTCDGKGHYGQSECPQCDGTGQVCEACLEPWTYCVCNGECDCEGCTGADA